VESNGSLISGDTIINDQNSCISPNLMESYDDTIFLQLEAINFALEGV
jgi:hypothetical protein